jgi:hypothetical protein
MYPVQASLKQVQFLYNWSTEVPKEVPERTEAHQTEKGLEQEGIAGNLQLAHR